MAKMAGWAPGSSFNNGTGMIRKGKQKEKKKKGIRASMKRAGLRKEKKRKESKKES